MESDGLICSDRPEYYLKLREFVLLDDFKLAMDSAGKNTISNISNDSEKDSGQLELDNKSMEVSMEKVLSDQEESTAKQKLCTNSYKNISLSIRSRHLLPENLQLRSTRSWIQV